MLAEAHLGIAVRFVDRAESEHLGEVFWAYASQRTSVGVANVARALDDFRVSPSAIEQTVVWFQNRLEDTGAIVATCSDLLRVAPPLQECLGPDILFMGLDASFGFCYEVNEHNNTFRWWDRIAENTSQPKETRLNP